MKKFIIAAMMLLTTFTALAQHPGPGPGPGMSPEEMALQQALEIREVCNVSDDQFIQIYTVLFNQSKAMEAEMDSLRNVAGEDEFPTFNPEAMKKRHEETVAKLKEVLTPEQFEAYEKMQKNRRRKGGLRPGGPRPEGPRP